MVDSCLHCKFRNGAWRPRAAFQDRVLSFEDRIIYIDVYINKLSESLSKLPVSGCCSNTVVYHLMYADDIVLFAPSAKGLQNTINGCDNSIIFNSSKSQLMFLIQ